MNSGAQGAKHELEGNQDPCHWRGQLCQRNLTEALGREREQVRAFCYYNANGSRGWLDFTDTAIASDVDFRLGDIRDARFAEESCRDIEIVIHLAALIAIPYSARTDSYVV